MPGLQFFKLDLHTHTPASKCYLNKTDTAVQIVQAALGKGLNAIAITDHNSADWIDMIKEASSDTSLVIFPGVEISMSEGFHLIALFDPIKGQKHVVSFLGAIDIEPDNYGKTNALCTKSVYDVIEIINNRNGLAILAHIDSYKGAFCAGVEKKDNGKIGVPLTVYKLFNEASYDAVECVKGKLPAGFDKAHHITRTPAIYQASDNPDPEDSKKHSLSGLGTRYSWFHMEQINIEGLRQCFSDPEVRICLMDKMEEHHYPKIISMKIGSNGFLRNLEIPFHQGLNCIIGGKGVGKSILIEFLRFVLNQPSLDPSIAMDHLGKLEKRLTPNTPIEIVYELANGTQYKIEKIFRGNQQEGEFKVPKADFACKNLTTGESYSGDIPSLFPILAYSQTEVIKISENKQAQLNLIDKFLDTRENKQAIIDLQKSLIINDEKLDDSLKAKGQLDECQKEIDTLAAKIEALNKALDNPLFINIKNVEEKKRLHQEKKTYVYNLKSRLTKWKEEINEYHINDLPETQQTDEKLTIQHQRTVDAKNGVTFHINNALSELDTALKEIDTVMLAWIPRYEIVAKEYALFLKEIGGDKENKESERQQLERQKEKFEEDANQYRSLVSDMDEVWEERKKLLDRLEEIYQVKYEQRLTKFNEITKLSEEKLNLLLEHASDRKKYRDNLSDLLKGGQNSPSLQIRHTIADNIPPRILVDLVIDKDIDTLATEAGITELWAGRVVDKLWSCDDFQKVLALQHDDYPEDTPSIQFLKEGGNYAELNELSVGQKCTALLIIALCDGSMPVVIDQPEDALDIISVWEDISMKLRHGKFSRQFILTTHNSSVAVSADADQFIVLQAGADKGEVVHIGAIDTAEVRDSVLQILEGGEVPYVLRAKKFNLKQGY